MTNICNMQNLKYALCLRQTHQDLWRWFNLNSKLLTIENCWDFTQLEPEWNWSKLWGIVTSSLFVFFFLMAACLLRLWDRWYMDQTKVNLGAGRLKKKNRCVSNLAFASKALNWPDPYITQTDSQQV